jgi:hypothetical protein
VELTTDQKGSYYLPADEFPARTQIQLRLAPTRNNQRELVNWAADYEFAAKLERLGAIAQLGERLHGMQEVAGSIPAGSTLGLGPNPELFSLPADQSAGDASS